MRSSLRVSIICNNQYKARLHYFCGRYIELNLGSYIRAQILNVFSAESLWALVLYHQQSIYPDILIPARLKFHSGLMCHYYISLSLSGARDNFSKHLGQQPILQSSHDSKIVATRKHDTQTAKQREFPRLLKSCSILPDIADISLMIRASYIFLADINPVVSSNLQALHSLSCVGVSFKSFWARLK